MISGSIHKMLDAGAGIDASKTSLLEVFNRLILPVAKKARLSPDDMIKRVFVFTHRESLRSLPSRGFIPRDQNTWVTEHMQIKRAFTAAGYPVPEIVYWNVSSRAPYTAFPVLWKEPGAGLLSGSGPGAFKVFMDGVQAQVKQQKERGLAAPPSYFASAGTSSASGGVSRETDNGNGKATGDEEPIDPVILVKKAVENPSFAGLVVYD
jgi:hypothetical protein